MASLQSRQENSQKNSNTHNDCHKTFLSNCILHPIILFDVKDPKQRQAKTSNGHVDYFKFACADKQNAIPVTNDSWRCSVIPNYQNGMHCGNHICCVLDYGWCKYQHINCGLFFQFVFLMHARVQKALEVWANYQRKNHNIDKNPLQWFWMWQKPWLSNLWFKRPL